MKTTGIYPQEPFPVNRSDAFVPVADLLRQVGRSDSQLTFDAAHIPATNRPRSVRLCGCLQRDYDAAPELTALIVAAGVARGLPVCAPSCPGRAA